MDYLPVFLDLRGRDVLVVGAGPVAARKAELLLRAGARVVVVAPAAGEAVARLAELGRIQYRARRCAVGDLREVAAAVIATGEAEEAEAGCRIAMAARQAGIPVNVVDCPERSTFVFPAVIDRSPLLVAVSSGGAAPLLARLLRARLESLIPHGYGRLAAFAGRFRAAVRDRISDPVARRHFWEQVLDGPAASEILAGRDAAAAARLEAMLRRDCPTGAARGEVYLVGAGPGDPELLTVRALRLMQQADIVLYDRLVAPAVLDLVRRDAERIDVGKRCGHHRTSQAEIGRLILWLAGEGHRVLRLKGGDPLLFGRGGEELELLAAHGVPFQVVPGITAAAGCGAYAGIPMTHRGRAHSCLFVTGHRSDGRLDLGRYWPGRVRRSLSTWGCAQRARSRAR